MTPQACYSYYPIDASDILKYEYDDYRPEKAQYYRELYDYLQHFYLRAGIAPFLTWDMVRKKQASKLYYKRQVKLLQNGNVPLTIFSCKGKFYDMTEPCIIEREKVNGLDFQKLFAYKLHQYADALLHIPAFLHFHLQHNFEQDQGAYSEFLRLVLVQYKHLLTKDLTSEVKHWVQLHPTINYATDTDTASMNEPSVSDQTPALENEQPPAPTPPLIPKGFRVMKGKWTLEQMQHFFSFLYLEPLNMAPLF